MNLGLKLKTLLVLGVVSLLGAAPAMAHSPYPRAPATRVVNVGFTSPTFHVGFGWGTPVHRAPRVDRHALRRGIALEREGRDLIARGYDLERRGFRFGNWHMTRKGERLQARGHALVREGQDLQARARW